MKQYKLRDSFCGKPRGTVFTLKDEQVSVTWEYQEATIRVPVTAFVMERIIKKKHARVQKLICS